MSLKIILADDHRILRDGLRSIIEKKPGMEIVAEAENGRETVQLAKKLDPDIVIMDISMPDMNGMEATRAIVEEAPGVRVLALSMHSDKRFVAKMLNAGASGYLRKDCASDELIHAIETVMKGQVYLSQKIVGVVAKDFARLSQEKDSSAVATLTFKERQVLQLIAEGKSTREIAEVLFSSTKTIEKHRQNIMDKLNLRTIAELTKYAVREGITPLEE